VSDALREKEKRTLVRRDDSAFSPSGTRLTATHRAPDDRAPYSKTVQAGDLVTWKKVVNDRSDVRGYRYDSYYGTVLSKSHETKGGNCILKILCGTQIHTRTRLRVVVLYDDSVAKV